MKTVSVRLGPLEVVYIHIVQRIWKGWMYPGWLWQRWVPRKVQDFVSAPEAWINDFFPEDLSVRRAVMWGLGVVFVLAAMNLVLIILKIIS